jgi:hypothetical protein
MTEDVDGSIWVATNDQIVEHRRLIRIRISQFMKRSRPLNCVNHIPQLLFLALDPQARFGPQGRPDK